MPRGLFVEGLSISNENRPVAGGAFADVYMGELDGNTVAIKRLRGFMFHDDHEKSYKVLLCYFMLQSSLVDVLRKRFCREALIWRQLRHPRILPLLGVDHDDFRTRTSLSMISPWMAQGTLLQYLSHIQDAPLHHAQLASFGRRRDIEVLS